MDNRVVLTQPRRARTRLLSLAAGALLVAAACNSSPAASPPTGTATPPPPSAPASQPASVAPSAVASAAASAAASAGAASALDVEAKEFAYDLPKSVPAGLTHVVLKNTGKEEHQAQIGRLTEGKTIADLTAALANPNPTAALALLTLVGGPNLVAPGASGSTDVALQPGTHVFLCFISGADNIPHLAKGMVAPIEVTAPAATADLPSGDAAVALQDFAFVGLDSLTAGKHTINVSNKGPQPHEAGIIKLADGKTAADLVAMFNATTPPAGPPPWTDVGGIGALSVGETSTMDVDLPAGDYAFICFVPDAATGKPHAALGMIGAFAVK
ncbi:MAG: hypothetical protein QOF49_417 [Chloroflexota bacterium]|jgi:uncharacterized cupredoxin-like copper-binding protein|nr:hypothetical protein [Chloroflexota bacterium]